MTNFDYVPPRNPLSFTYHISLVPAYRDEMHHDIRVAFRRFGITADLFQGGVVTLDQFQRVSFDIERAAYAARSPEQPAITKPMQHAAKAYFDAMVPLFAQLLTNPLASRSDVAPPDRSDDSDFLLRRLFFLVHSSRAQQLWPGPPLARLNQVLVNANQRSDFVAAWERVHAALSTGRVLAPSDATAYSGALMPALALEYADSTWPECW
ncbi:MAG TPA: hypothetical protein VG937_10620 [Polyangiaceae bacterium]|nr:hypothetical protein [Polyangiaceae bacterium]